MPSASQGWEVTCVKCDRLKWPYLPEKPRNYICVLCRGGIGAARRESGRKTAASRIARRNQEPTS